MNVIEIQVKHPIEPRLVVDPHEESIEHQLFWWLSCLQRSGQIVNQNWVITQTVDAYVVQVVCPAADALDARHLSPYGKEAYARVCRWSGQPPHYRVCGVSVESEPDYVPAPVSAYVLRWWRSSPLLDGVTEQSIPLYTIPFTYHDGASFDDVWSWHRAYAAMYRLWLQSRSYESFARDQLQDPQSDLSRQGRAICKKIERKTGIPAYYFLFNDREGSYVDGVESRCPVSGEMWFQGHTDLYLAQKAEAAGYTHPPQAPSETRLAYPFCSEFSRLVSEWSPNYERPAP